MATPSILALIPARGGSKGVPNKNIAPVGGRPLIAWSILAAQQARSVDRVVVSTDSPAIAAVARAWGAEVPFLRPAELARDDTPGIAPALHALRWLEEHEGRLPDALLYLQPTSPLRSAVDIDGAVALLEERAADAIVSGTPAAQHPYWVKRLDAEGRIQSFLEGALAATRRQDLPPAYALNGAIYLCRSTVLLARESWYTERTHMYVMPESRSLDVDSHWELHLADLLLSAREHHASV